MATTIALNSIPSDIPSWVIEESKSGIRELYRANGHSYEIVDGQVFENIIGGTVTNTKGNVTTVALNNVPSDIPSWAIEESKGGVKELYRANGRSYEIVDGQVYMDVHGTPVTSTETSPTGASSTATTGTSSTSTTSPNSQSSPTSSKSSSATGNTDVKGLNAAGVTAIKDAISQFVKGYSSKVANVGTTTATIQNAVKGTASEKAISNLSAAINSSVTQSLNKLNTFANQLDTVKSAYSKADSSNTSVTTYTTNLGKK